MNHPELIEIGLKLANFRAKLRHRLGRKKKLTQADFGAMFGGYSTREINSYERGENQIPARLLYNLWKKGYSIDSLFAEADVLILTPSRSMPDTITPARSSHVKQSGREIGGDLVADHFLSKQDELQAEDKTATPVKTPGEQDQQRGFIRPFEKDRAESHRRGKK